MIKKLIILCSVMLLSLPSILGFFFFPDSPPPGVTAGLVCLRTGCNMTGAIYMNNNYIYDVYLQNVVLQNVTFSNVIYVNYSQVLNPIWVNRSGDTMTGNLAMGNNDISGVDTLYANYLIGLLDWSNLTNIPAGFFDGIDNDKQGDGGFLTNDSTTIYFNGTMLNATIQALDTDSDTHIISTPPYLYDDFTYIYFNETVLNRTIRGNLNISVPSFEVDPFYYNEKPLIAFTNKSNLFTVDQHIADGYRLYFRNSTNNTYFFYNTTNQTLQLIVNGIIQQDWGASTRIYGKSYFLDDALFGNVTGSAVVIDTNLLVTQNTTTYGFFIGNGSLITDVCHTDGSGCGSGQVDTQKVGGGYYLYNDSTTIYLNETRLNISVDARDSDTTYENLSEFNNDVGYITEANDTDTTYENLSEFNNDVGYITEANDTDTHVQGTQPWLYNDSTNMYFNETYFNNSVYALTGIFEENVTVVVAGGIGNGVTVDCCNGANEILQIAVFPTTITNKYRFYANETIGGEVVDSNRALHTGNWIVAHAGSVVEDDTISYRLTNVQIDESFIVRVRYQR